MLVLQCIGQSCFRHFNRHNANVRTSAREHLCACASACVCVRVFIGFRLLERGDFVRVHASVSMCVYVFPSYPSRTITINITYRETNTHLLGTNILELTYTCALSYYVPIVMVDGSTYMFADLKRREEEMMKQNETLQTQSQHDVRSSFDSLHP